jgi:DNA ligase (NAD+)
MDKITEYLMKCSREYYAGCPSISDEVFDSLAETVGFNQVGAKQHEDREKHFYPMYSLQKYYANEGMKNPLEGHTDIDISPKIDGAAVSLLYIDGKLVRALTRGDGEIGKLVTDKFLATKLVPQTIEAGGILQITGELAAPKHIENARNYAAGSLNLNNVEEFRTRAVTFFAYGIQPSNHKTFRESMQYLSNQGFNTIKDAEIQNIYPCDGVVFRLNQYTDFYNAGYTAKHPKGAVAVKERQEAVETTLLDIEWNTGKSGKVTPVAILEPVYIGDKLVKRATLNNIEFIRALDLHLGDTVGVILGGEIIPKIVHKSEA